MPLDVINRRHPGTLRQAEVVDQYGIAHVHPIKRVAAQGWHFDSRLRGINGETRVEHGSSPAGLLPLHRPPILNLEGGLTIYFRNWRELFTIWLRTLTKLHALLGKPLNCIENSTKSVKMVKIYRAFGIARSLLFQFQSDLMWINGMGLCRMGVANFGPMASGAANGLGRLPRNAWDVEVENLVRR